MSSQTISKTDDVHVDIGITLSERTDTSKALSDFLASTYVLYLKTLYYHWNVTGPQFVALHQIFEEQYSDLHLAGDSLAERIRALGHFTPGTLREYLNSSSIKDDEKLPESAELMVKNLLEANEQCSREARKVLKIAEAGEDEVTVDMMVERMTYHDKSAWMLRSILQ